MKSDIAGNAAGAQAVGGKRPAYDTLDPIHEEARRQDDTFEGIDWDEIIATTQDDFEAGRFAFNSADYPTHEEAMVALRAWLHEVVEEAEREARANSAPDAKSP